MRVLLLRPHEEAVRTAGALAARGHEAVMAPLLYVKSVAGALPEGPFDAALATSARAIHRLSPNALKAVSALPLLSVGARTASAARAAGVRHVLSPTADARALAAKVLGQIPLPARLLYLAAQDRKPWLEEALTTAGYQVAVQVVYSAQAGGALPGAVVDALRAGDVQAALHFSRRSAALFCTLACRAGLADAARGLRHVAISRDAAEGLSPLAPPDLRIAATPDEDSLLDALG